MNTVGITEAIPSFCGKRHTVPFPLPTIEKGIKLIEQILSKSILCRHDVEILKQAYKEILLKEREFQRAPEKGSQSTLQKIIEKIEKLASNCQADAKARISLFYMQGFSPRIEKVNDCFKILGQLEKTSEQTKKIVALIPRCATQNELEVDARKLIGWTLSGDLLEVLARKSKELETLSKITSAQSQLAKARNRNRKNYPPYLDEIIEKGHLFLFEHLMEMIDLSDRIKREARISQLPFSAISYIVIETRAAIIRKVEDSIPASQNAIIFILGSSGTGKSTTLCYLKGDDMVKHDSGYESLQRSAIIGHMLDTSCTFLPKVVVENGCVIVDFPGFDDSHGSLVSMGMELALKALMKVYKSKVLILESIVNTETRCQSLGDLGIRLNRLFENKSACFLGITKYTKEPHYIRLKSLESMSQATQLTESNEELACRQTLNDLLLSGANDPNTQSQIAAYRLQLSELQKKKSNGHQTSKKLPERPDSIQLKKSIEEEEKKLVNQIGLKNLFRFSDLKDSSQRMHCLKQLSEKSTWIRIKTDYRLPTLMTTFLESRFKVDLLKEIESLENPYGLLGDIAKLETSILQASLVKTLLSDSRPEIGKFLHLPEMDPTLVRKFDQQIVSNWIKRCTALCVVGLNLTSLKNSVKEIAQHHYASRGDIKQFKEDLNRLREFIIRLEGCPDNPADRNSVWEEIRKRYAADINSVEEDHQLSKLATLLLGIPLGMPLGILNLKKWHKKYAKGKETIQEYSKQLNTLYNHLFRLKEIERTIEKVSSINQELASLKLVLESEDSVKSALSEKIQKVREIYNPDEWDKRTSLLKERTASPIRYHEALYSACTILNKDLFMIEFNCSQLSEDQEALKALCHFYPKGLLYAMEKKGSQLFLVHKNLYFQNFFEAMQILFDRTIKEIEALNQELEEETKQPIGVEIDPPNLKINNSADLHRCLRAWMTGFDKCFTLMDRNKKSWEEEVLVKALADNEKGVSSMLATIGREGFLKIMKELVLSILLTINKLDATDKEGAAKIANICNLWNIDKNTLELFNILVCSKRQVSWRIVEDWKENYSEMDPKIPLNRALITDAILSRIPKKNLGLEASLDKAFTGLKKGLSSPRLKEVVLRKSPRSKDFEQNK